MKSILITFDQAHYEQVVSVLDRLNCRGFTRVERVQGRGSQTGDPHYGSHAWPALNSAIIAVVEDHRVDPLLNALRDMDEKKNQLGLRAFVWNIEQSI
jgi:nitrogen regulatory protein PII